MSSASWCEEGNSHWLVTSVTCMQDYCGSWDAHAFVIFCVDKPLNVLQETHPTLSKWYVDGRSEHPIHPFPHVLSHSPHKVHLYVLFSCGRSWERTIRPHDSHRTLRINNNTSRLSILLYSAIGLAFPGKLHRYLHQLQNLQFLNNPYHEALGLARISHSQSPGFNGCLPAYCPPELFSKSQLPLEACP